MKFDNTKNDVQATPVKPIKAKDFPFDAYVEYYRELTQRCRDFTVADQGALVYRRMRVAEVFSYGCRDMKSSLELQLGALKKSMDYKADIPNFLEPWYGLGVVAAAFGMKYIWNPGQAPAVHPAFPTIKEALNYDFIPVKETGEGRHSLNMIEYFLEQTQGKIPVSMGDIQSPFNNATNIVETSDFLTSMILDPEKVLKFLDVLAELEIDFYREQKKLIGNALVRPGHGFASSTAFQGFGMSDDNVVMIDEDTYLNLAAPSFIKLGNAFGGPVFHSCGNYSDKAGMLNKIEGLKMVDGAFTAETDPAPNPASPFRKHLSGSGIVLNARMVGNIDVLEETTRALWNKEMKLIVVTYCKTPQNQQEVYNKIHSICR